MLTLALVLATVLTSGVGATAGARVADLRLQLLTADGGRSEIEIDRAVCRDAEARAADGGEPRLRLALRPGDALVLHTADARAIAANVRVHVPDPVPPVLTGVVPARDHPALSNLVLQVVDEDGPLPGAALDWGETDDPSPTTRADAEGRIVVAARPAMKGTPTEPPLRRYLATEWCVHAPGHTASTRRPLALPVYDDVAGAAWLATGRYPVLLARRTGPQAGNERAIHVVDARWHPVPFARVDVVFPALPEVVTLGAYDAVRDGFRRTDEHGVAEVPVPLSVGLQVRVGGAPVATFGLADAAWPPRALGPRDLRLPELADATLVIDDVPADATAQLCAGAGTGDRTAVAPASTTLDAEARDLLGENGCVFPFWLCGPRPILASPRTTLQVNLAVGRPTSLLLDARTGRRRWTVAPDHGGPWRATARWSDLPQRDGAPNTR